MAEKKLPVLVRRVLQPAAKITHDAVVSWVDSQGTEIALTEALVKALFQGRNPFTPTECLLFLQQARSRRANPFLGQIYLVKYAPDSPASIVTGYPWLMERARDDPDYDNYATWAVDAQGKRIADGLETKETVVAYVCEVYNKSRRPVKFVARMAEFNKNQALWKTQPLVQLEKCAIANAHRRADPARLAGLYTEAEIGQRYAIPEPVVNGEVIAPPPAAEVEPEAVAQEPMTAEEQEAVTKHFDKVTLEGRLKAAGTARGIEGDGLLKWASDTFQRDITDVADLSEEQLTQLLAELEPAGQQAMGEA